MREKVDNDQSPVIFHWIDRDEKTVEAKDITGLGPGTPSGDKIIIRYAMEGRVTVSLLCVDGVKLSGKTVTVGAPRCEMCNLIIPADQESHVGVEDFIVEPTARPKGKERM